MYMTVIKPEFYAASNCICYTLQGNSVVMELLEAGLVGFVDAQPLNSVYFCVLFPITYVNLGREDLLLKLVIWHFKLCGTIVQENHVHCLQLYAIQTILICVRYCHVTFKVQTSAMLENSNNYFSGTGGGPIDFLFDSMFGFFETAYRMDLNPVGPNPTWRLPAKLEISNDDISATCRPVNFVLDSRCMF